MIKTLPKHIREKLNDDQLYIHLNLFIKFDKDGSGHVDSEELKSMLEELGFGDVSHNDCLAMIADLDADNTGNISFEEFNDLLIGLMYDDRNDSRDDDEDATNDDREQAASVLQKQFRSFLSRKETHVPRQSCHDNVEREIEKSIVSHDARGMTRLQLRRRLLPCDTYFDGNVQLQFGNVLHSHDTELLKDSVTPRATPTTNPERSEGEDNPQYLAVREQNAAKCIQRHFRLSVHRRELKKHKIPRMPMEKLRYFLLPADKNDAAVKIQGCFRGFWYRLDHSRTVKWVKRYIDNFFATFFSARGFTVLDVLRDIRIRDRRRKFSIRLQKFVRNKQRTDRILQWRDKYIVQRLSAVNTIQRNYRWYLIKKRVYEKRTKAAIEIQMFFFGVRRARKYVEYVRELRALQNLKAIEIQKMARGLIARRITVAKMRQEQRQRIMRISSVLIQSIWRGYRQRYVDVLGSIFWRMWKKFIIKLQQKIQEHKRIHENRQLYLLKVKNLRDVRQKNLNLYTSLKQVRAETKAFLNKKLRRPVRVVANRDDEIYRNSSPVQFKNAKKTSEFGIPYNAHAECERRKHVEAELRQKETKITKLRSKVKFLKEKLCNDSKKHEDDRKNKIKNQFKQLSDRQLMHFQRKNLYESLIGLNEAQEIPLKTLKKYGLDKEDGQPFDSTAISLPGLDRSPQKYG